MSADLRVVRPWATNRTHIVDVAPHQLDRATSLGSEFTTVLAERGVLEAVCGVAIRGKGFPVLMQEGILVQCRTCVAITGYEMAAAGNTRQESGWGWDGPRRVVIDVHSFEGGGAIAVAREPIETGRKKTLAEMITPEVADRLPEMRRRLRAWERNRGRESALAVTERADAIVDDARALLDALEKTP